MRLLLCIAMLGAAACLSAATSLDKLYLQEWFQFKSEHGKLYSDGEDMFRLQNFIDNKLKVANHNIRYNNGEVSYRMKMNKFSDMSQEEMDSQLLGLRPKKNPASKPLHTFSMLKDLNTLPSFVDWRTKGAVTAVKNQGLCGSCYAFSATGSLEGQHFMKTGKLVSLSEQNLVDCSGVVGNGGCNGGLMDACFVFVTMEGGIDTEESYPYIGTPHKSCGFSNKTIGATDVGYVDVAQDEVSLLGAVALVGPIAVGIDAGFPGFSLYSSGVYTEENCSKQVLNHGVLAVGYGTTDKGEDYWLVKNSWGPAWGEKGYIRMARNKDNMCGIATLASYPIV